MSSIIRQQPQVTRTRPNKVAPEMKFKNTEAASDKTDSGLAIPSETSPPKKPSTKQKSILKEAGSVLKTVIKGLGAAIVGLTVGTVASTIAGAIRGSAEGSAAGAATGESYGGNVGRAIGSFAGSVVGGIAGALAGSVAIPVIAADTLARKAGSLSETKAPKEQADPATIGKHKASTESQLTVALENFKLAAGKVGLDSNTINTKVTELKKTITANIETAYQDGCDLTSVDKQFRNKHDDFGLTSELATLLQSADVGKLASKDAAKSAKSAMSATKPTAIDTVGQNKAAAGFQGSIALDGEKTYTTEIKMQTTEFVSSASNKANGNTCGNLNLQTLTGADGKVRFKTLRHAALTAKPKAEETKNPFKKTETAANTASRLCENLNSKDPTKVEEATTELKKYGIKASDFKGFLSGKIDESKLTKKMAKQCGLLNKALDVGKAAWAAQGSPSGKVNITSLSLMTPDRPRAGLDGKGGEVGKLKDQAEAFKLLQSLGSADLQSMGIGDENTPVTFNVMTFNFGVNEGESLGAIKQKEYNTTAMTGLTELTQTKLDKLEESLKETTPGTKEHAQLTVEKKTIEALSQDIQGLYDTYTSPPSDLSKGLWRADQAYNLTAKIAFLTELCDGVNTCNCASGKDRTGMHVQNSLNYAALMKDRMASAAENPSESPVDVKSTWEMLKSPDTPSEMKTELQARNKVFMSETGQHNVQEWNTGSPGYKLYSDTLPNLFTRGGQTESYFSNMFGLTKAEVGNQLTMQAKFNAT